MLSPIQLNRVHRFATHRAIAFFAWVAFYLYLTLWVLTRNFSPLPLACANSYETDYARSAALFVDLATCESSHFHLPAYIFAKVFFSMFHPSCGITPEPPRLYA